MSKRSLSARLSPLTSSYIGSATAIFLILLSQFDLFLRWNWHQMPIYRHAWSMNDRLALVHGFLNNNFNFFLPETYNVNLQFPGVLSISELKGITAVDFPIHEYLVAILMGLLGTRDPFIFYSYIALLSTIGLFFLYRAFQLMTSSNVLAILGLTLVLSSPSFGYYNQSFIPGIPALSTAFVGLYFFVKYLKTSELKSFIWAILFFTLSALVRFPFIIILIAIGFLPLIKKLGWITFKIPIRPLIIGLLVVLAYFGYNRIISHYFGSVFLASPVIPESLSEFWSAITQIFETLIFQLHLWEFWWVYTTGFILGTLAFVFNWGNEKSRTLFLFGSVSLVGGVAYLMLMTGQLPTHDYYLLDSVFFPLVLTAVAILSFVRINSVYQKLAVLVVVYAFFAKGYNHRNAIFSENQKSMPWDRQKLYFESFKNSKSWLDSLGVSGDARFYTVDPTSPNMPFIQMERKGVYFMTRDTTLLNSSLEILPHDYLILPTMVIGSRYFDIVPQMQEEYQFISRKKGLVLFERKKNDNALPSIKTLLHKNAVTSSERGINDTLKLQSGSEYTAILEESLTSTGPLEILATFPKEDIVRQSQSFLTCSVERDSRSIYNYFYSLDDEIPPINSSSAHIVFYIPKTRKGDKLSLYIYHANGANKSNLPINVEFFHPQ